MQLTKMISTLITLLQMICNKIVRLTIMVIRIARCCVVFIIFYDASGEMKYGSPM